MKTPPLLSRLKPDPYILAIMGMVVLAAIAPIQGQHALLLADFTNLAIAFLFFLYGGRLSRQAVIAGISHWRLQLLVLACTFVFFPLLGIGLALLLKPWLAPELTMGLIFLSILPSTVQSSIGFTSIARGNIAAAVCAASLSNMAGILITPFLVTLVLSANGQAVSLEAVLKIMLQLLLPFALGQLLRNWLSPWLEKQRKILGYIDRGTILLVVYAAFSEGVNHGLWNKLEIPALLLLLVVSCLLLAAILWLTSFLSLRLGFSREDRIAIIFCGSKKSMASGIPMANILFAGSSVGLLVLPLMLFHQLQLMVCAYLAQRYAAS